LVIAAWLGTYIPAQHEKPCDDCKAPRVVASAGSVRVLPSGDGPPPDGKVIVASPLLGLVVPGTIDKGTIQIAFFTLDTRDSDDGVVLLPADTVARFVKPTAADVLAIKDAIARADLLSVGDRNMTMRALRDMEVGALDLDGDGKADVVATYGCTQFFQSSCQTRGQFFLAHRGAKWVQIE
jgi:hypothetical protein